ncbi:MAG: hypothetical protein MUE45_01450 [Methanoregulaceae archaeon]|jgi:nitrate reductase gamma subunit|nr:hypothetical protein [Methanoregulaceae archaeon]
MQYETVIPLHLTLLVILSSVAMRLLLQGMLWRIEAVGFDWIAAIPGLAAVGVLVMAGRQFHYELCHVLRKNKGVLRARG